MPQVMANQKFLLVVAFGAGILVVLCNAQCSRSAIQLNPGKPKGCYYNGQLHPLNSKWRTEDCLDCTCDSSGNYECCKAYGKPVDYDPERCHFVFDKENCVYKLIPNEDPNKQCESYGIVG